MEGRDFAIYGGTFTQVNYDKNFGTLLDFAPYYTFMPR